MKRILLAIVVFSSIAMAGYTDTQLRLRSGATSKWMSPQTACTTAKQLMTEPINSQALAFEVSQINGETDTVRFTAKMQWTRKDTTIWYNSPYTIRNMPSYVVPADDTSHTLIGPLSFYGQVGKWMRFIISLDTCWVGGAITYDSVKISNIYHQTTSELLLNGIGAHSDSADTAAYAGAAKTLIDDSTWTFTFHKATGDTIRAEAIGGRSPLYFVGSTRATGSLTAIVGVYRGDSSKAESLLSTKNYADKTASTNAHESLDIARSEMRDSSTVVWNDSAPQVLALARADMRDSATIVWNDSSGSVLSLARADMRDSSLAVWNDSVAGLLRLHGQADSSADADKLQGLDTTAFPTLGRAVNTFAGNLTVTGTLTAASVAASDTYAIKDSFIAGNASDSTMVKPKVIYYSVGGVRKGLLDTAATRALWVVTAHDTGVAVLALAKADMRDTATVVWNDSAPQVLALARADMRDTATKVWNDSSPGLLGLARADMRDTATVVWNDSSPGLLGLARADMRDSATVVWNDSSTVLLGLAKADMRDSATVVWNDSAPELLGLAKADMRDSATVVWNDSAPELLGLAKADMRDSATVVWNDSSPAVLALAKADMRDTATATWNDSAVALFRHDQVTDNAYTLNCDTALAATITRTQGFATACTSATGEFLATGANHTMLITSSGVSTTPALLPAVAGVPKGHIYTWVKVDAGGVPVVVTANGGETINGTGTYSLATQWKRVTIQNTGTAWVIIENN
jgi:hypothetical protein